MTCLSLQSEVDADRLGVWGTSFSGGHVLHVAAYDPRVKAVVSQVGAMDADAIMKATATPEQYAALEEMTVKERIRRATEGGEVYIPNTLSPGETFAFQPDAESYEFAHTAQATVAPSWRDEVTMSSVGACLEYAPARSIDLIAPRPLLMFLAKGDSIAPPDTIRAAFARAGVEPQQLVEIERHPLLAVPGSCRADERGGRRLVQQAPQGIGPTATAVLDQELLGSLIPRRPWPARNRLGRPQASLNRVLCGSIRPMRLEAGETVVASRILGDARSGDVVRGTDGTVVGFDVGGLGAQETYTVIFISHGFLDDTLTTLSGVAASDLRKR